MSLQKEKCHRCGKNTIVTDIESPEIFCPNVCYGIRKIIFHNYNNHIFNTYY